MKKIIFLTGTRADFGKLKSLISILKGNSLFESSVFVTGMHLNPIYGNTYKEVERSGFKNIHKFSNHNEIENMDITLSKTIQGFSRYVSDFNPDLIVVHGDRVEALAGAIVGSLNNILVAHIEGGELSGTIDELIRHAVSKMSHIHLVANEEAKQRLVQLGEYEKSIFILGSPDLDLMNENNLPSLNEAKKYYQIEFNNFSIAMFHPITTEYRNIKKYAKSFINALLESNEKYILIYPNNDIGSKEILEEIKKIEKNKNFRIFPSLRFEYFLRFLKESKFIIGNSSAGIREAPYYNIPTVDIGTRQKNRSSLKSIIRSDYTKKNIIRAISKVNKASSSKINDNIESYFFGKGESDKKFLKLLESNSFWSIKLQKQFQDFKDYV